MKKILLSVILLLSFTNVNAKEEYTEYKFVGYSEEIQEESDLVKYELTYLNKFYKYEEVNVYYGEEDYESPERPYKNEEDYKKVKAFSLDREEEYENHHILAIKNYENYNTREISFIGFNSYESKIFEIEVYSGEEKIDFSITELEWLKDGNTKEGEILSDACFNILLDNSYDVESLKIMIYYEYHEGEAPFSELEIYNEQGENHLFKYIYLNDYVSNENIYVIDIMSEKDFNTFFPRYGLGYWQEIERLDEYTYYVYFKKLYKYYNLEKVYYKTEDLDYLEGYEYDKEESIPIYRVYKRDKIEAPNKPDESTKEEIPTAEVPNEEQKVEENIVNDEPIQNTTEKPKEKETIAIVKNEDMVNDNIKEPEKEELIRYVEMPCNCDKEIKYSERTNKLIRIVLIILAGTILTDIIRVIYVKFKK